MATTNFTPGTPIVSDWLNDVDAVTYELGNTTGAARVGSDDGSGGSLWTTVAGFIARFTAIGRSIVAAADAAAVRTLLSAVDTGRTISAAGLATGGGDLSANRTITVTASSQAEAEAGTNTTTVMTPQRVKQALRANGTAPIYACRAWVNFNGTGTVAIRASGNVTSITDNGTGDYSVNLTTALEDANYALIVSAVDSTLVANIRAAGPFAGPSYTQTTSVARFGIRNGSGTLSDVDFVSVAIFR